jgi:superfamily II DNA or RNA helicase
VLFRVPTEEFPRALLRRYDEFGFEEYDLARPPGRLWPEHEPDAILQGVDAARVERLASPAALLEAPSLEPTQTVTRRSIARLYAWFLVLEDRQRRLDRRGVVALAHQASLVRHCVDDPRLKRVLVADEVGLGKTVEAGLIVKDLMRDAPGLRVLYLAPARLVRNVHQEFTRLELPFRVWSSDPNLSDASLDDDRIIASIHRASHERHVEAFAGTRRPWDVIIVDECHHLSDWRAGGGAPVQKLRLVRRLADRLGPDGRLLLLSGTPHQGHASRFENLLALLQQPGDAPGDLAGRVIYRTKADVHDWDGRPLFPGRQVNPPIEIVLEPAYRAWLASIHEFFEPGQGEGGRAAGWRAGLALQWATSSLEAGLGFLVRQGIRAQLAADDPALAAAIAAIRPYRGGAPTEPVAAVYARIRREVERQLRDDDLDDVEEHDAQGWRPDLRALTRLLHAGVALLERAGRAKWDVLWQHVLERAPEEKVVLFAQPIETVTSLAAYLERRGGVRPSLVIGAQDDAARDQEIARFRTDPTVRFLVSSRAGGEGLNLQVARRLVHLDVPWNPMELEQRVGRVHRFGSRRTIVVDTLVVSGSRETDAYRIAYAKLQEIAATMVPPERFQELFARVMALVPPEELQGILVAAPLAPLSTSNERSVQDLVTAGFERWQSFDARFKHQGQRLRALDPGTAGWDDLRDFLERYAGAERAPGYETLRFRSDGREVVEDSVEAIALTFGDEVIALGETDGMPVRGHAGRLATPVGLNAPPIAAVLRRHACPVGPAGPAILGWSAASREFFDPAHLPPRFGVLAFARQEFTLGRGFTELGTATLELYVVTDAGAAPVDPPHRRAVVRALAAATARREPPADQATWSACLRRLEAEVWTTLRRPPPSTGGDRVLCAVTPLLAAIVVNE